MPALELSVGRGSGVVSHQATPPPKTPRKITVTAKPAVPLPPDRLARVALRGPDPIAGRAIAASFASRASFSRRVLKASIATAAISSRALSMAAGSQPR